MVYSIIKTLNKSNWLALNIKDFETVKRRLKTFNCFKVMTYVLTLIYEYINIGKFMTQILSRSLGTGLAQGKDKGSLLLSTANLLKSTLLRIKSTG